MEVLGAALMLRQTLLRRSGCRDPPVPGPSVGGSPRPAAAQWVQGSSCAWALGRSLPTPPSLCQRNLETNGCFSSFSEFLPSIRSVAQMSKEANFKENAE